MTSFAVNVWHENPFYTLSDARVVIAAWRKKYNQLRPHRSLLLKTPEEFALD